MSAYSEAVLADNPIVYVPMQEMISDSKRGHEVGIPGRGLYDVIAASVPTTTSWGRLLIGQTTPYGMTGVKVGTLNDNNAITVKENLGLASATDYSVEILCSIDEITTSSIDRSPWWLGNNASAAIGLKWKANSYDLEICHMNGTTAVGTVSNFFQQLVPKAWMHWVLTWDQADLKFYVDSELIATVAEATWSSLANTDAFVGAFDPTTATDSSWPGSLSQFAIYDSEITAEDHYEALASVLPLVSFEELSDNLSDDIWDYSTATPTLRDGVSSLTFVTANTNAGNGSTITVTDPSTSSGQQLFAICLDRANSITLIPSDSGWTLLESTGILENSIGVKLYSRASNSGTDPANWTFARSSPNGDSSTSVVTVAAFDGLDSIYDGIQFEYTLGQTSSRSSIYAPEFYLPEGPTVALAIVVSAQALTGPTPFSGFSTINSYLTGPSIILMTNAYDEAGVIEQLITDDATANSSIVLIVPIIPDLSDVSLDTILTELLESLLDESGNPLLIES